MTSSNFVPALGVDDPRECKGLRSDSALFWAPEKARMRWPILNLSARMAVGTPKNAGVT